MDFTYKTNGTCARAINITLNGDIVEDLTFIGGCNGNTKGIGALVKGMKIDDVISRLENIRCGFKSTSCPDQLAQALKEYKANKG